MAFESKRPPASVRADVRPESLRPGAVRTGRSSATGSLPPPRQTSHSRDVILQNETITLWYYPQLKIVHHQMMHSPTSEEFRELLNRGADLIEQFRAQKWLSDDRGNTLLRPDDEEWSEEEWMPRVLRGGFKYWAIVLPEAAIGQLNMRRLAAHHKQHGIISCIETKPSRAMDWLKDQ